MKNKKTFLAAGTACLIGLLLSACAPLSQAEYASYSSLAELSKRAETVVQVKVESSADGKLYSEWSGDNPTTNPYAGDAQEEQPTTDESAAAAVIHQAKVEEVVQGSVEKGAGIDIAQLANDPETVYLREGGTYLLFLLTEGDGPAGIVGGDQGQYLVDGDEYLPVDVGQSFRFDRAEVEKLKSAMLK